jgi:hypothetical protein
MTVARVNREDDANALARDGIGHQPLAQVSDRVREPSQDRRGARLGRVSGRAVLEREQSPLAGHAAQLVDPALAEAQP